MRVLSLLLGVVCVLVFFTGLGGTGLLDQREARDAEVARELLATREPLTPRLGDQPWFEKPALAYVPEVTARLASGPFDLRSRQIRAVVAVLLVLFTASMAAGYFGARAGVFAALVLATSLGMPNASRGDGTQLIATLLGWSGAMGLADAVFGRTAGRGARLVVAYGALAATLVCAGILPALWPLGALALYLALARAREGWRHAQPLAGLIVMLVLALPWYAVMVERHGAAFLSRAPFFPYATEARGPWYAGPALFLSLLVFGFFPWSALLPGALLHAATGWRIPRLGRSRRDAARDASGRPATDPFSRERREEHAAHYCIACLIAGLVPILFYPTPPLSAVLPALPAAAMLCGRFLDHLYEDSGRLIGPLGRAVLMVATLGTAGGILLAMIAPRVREAAPDLRLLGSITLLASWSPFLAHLIGRHRMAAALMMLPVAIGTPIVTLRVLPKLEGYLSARDVAVAMSTASPPAATLVLVDAPPSSLRLYTRRELVVGRPLEQAMHERRASDAYTYVAFRPARERLVARLARAPLEILIRTPSMILARVARP